MLVGAALTTASYLHAPRFIHVETTLTLSQIRYFLSLSETLNFTRAAAACNVTQPAFTRAIRGLEEELGGRLFSRDNRGAQMTDLGRLILPALRRAHEAAREAKRLSSEFNGTQALTCRIALAPSVSTSLLVNLIGELTKRTPHIRVETLDSSTDTCSRSLSLGNVDAVLTGEMDVLPDDVTAHMLTRERLLVLLSAAHSWAHIDHIPVSRLNELLWLVHDGITLPKTVLRLFANFGLWPKVIHRSTNGRQLEQMISAGLAFMLVPEHSLPRPGLLMRPIEGDSLWRNIQLLLPHNVHRRSPADAIVQAVRHLDRSHREDVAERAIG